jgi:predicted CXXCH cytochrome family protein
MVLLINQITNLEILMKKRLLVITLVLLLLVLGVSLASANGGPHGDYTATTDACAGCHRTHTAIGPKLLVSNSTYNLCMSCHGSSGTGANTNVDDGIYLASRDDAAGDRNHGGENTPSGNSLLGGGFTNYDGESATSSHDMIDEDNTNIAWGNGVDRGVGAAITDVEFSCASCHDPHGSGNYRILKERVNGVEISVEQVDENAKDYDTEQWGSGTSDLCAACHASYHETAGWVGSDSSGQVYGGGFTHRVDMPYHYGGNVNPETIGFTDDGGVNVKVPLAESGSSDRVVCMTCHLPHGSSATMSGIADGGGLPGETSATDSALLRLENRAVCEACHQK